MKTGFLRTRTRIFILAVILALLLAIITALPVRAASSGVKCDPIASGLWAGVNLLLRTNYGCQDKPANRSQNNNQQSRNNTPPPQQRNKYVALGDSIAAGIGLSPRTAGTDRACGTTDQAYPAKVAQALGMPVQNLACSGATAGDLFTEQHLSGTSRDIEPQLPRAFAAGKPTLITVAAGANDTYWDYFLRKCYASSCGTATDEAVTDGLLTSLELKLEYVLRDINARSNGQPPRVIFTGYYQPFSTSCAQQQTNVSRTELRWLREQTRQLNQTIQDVVSDYSFALFVPINFGGHELCTTDPWVQGVNDAAPFHPTVRGQQAIANAVLGQLR